MKRIIILSTLAACSATASISAQLPLNSPDAEGYFARGTAMFRDRNYNGCIDQLLQLRNLDADPALREEALYYIAMATLHSGDDEAIDLLEQFLVTYPASPRIQDVEMSMADYYFTRSNYPEALKRYETIAPQALTGDRRDDMEYRMAYSNMMLGENDKADGYFDRLTGNKRYGNAALFYRGYIAYCRHDYRTAKEYFAKVNTSVEPGDSADCYLCQIYFIENDYDKALELALKILGRGCPDEFATEINRIAGESLYHTGDSAGAVTYLRKYMRLCDNRHIPSAAYILGVCLYADADYSEAVPMFRKAAGVSDAMGQSAYLYLGQCYVKQGNTDGALMAFENAYRQNFDKKVAETAFYNYIVARADGGRVPFGNSVAMYREFLDRYPYSPYAGDIMEHLVSSYLSSNDYENALRELGQIKHPSPYIEQSKQKVLFMLGTREYRAGNTDSAIDYLSQALRTSHHQPRITMQSRLWRGIALYDTGNYSGAIDDLSAYLKAAPKNDSNRSAAYYNRGYSRFASELYPQAFDDFLSVTRSEVTPSMRADAFNRIADCLYYQRDYRQATTYYNKALDTYPATGDYATYRIAVMKGLDRDTKGKINGFDTLMDRYPSSPLIPAALLDMAQTHTAAGNNTAAFDTYRTLIQRYPSTAQGRKGLLQMALLQCDSGDTAEGMETYRKVISTYPTSEEAAVAIDDLKRIYADAGKLRDFADFVNSVPDAPRIDISEMDEATFRAAESDYLDDHSTARLKTYLEEYPDGAYMARAAYYLAEDAEEKGDRQSALDYAEKVITLRPDAEAAEDALLIKADAQRDLGMGELALESYTALESKASTPRNIQDARVGIMRTALELGRHDAVLAATDKLLSSNLSGDITSDEVSFSRAVSLSKTGHIEEARAIWENLATDPGTLIGSKSAVFLGESLLESDEAARAAEVADNLINSGTPHDYWLARGYILLSDALSAQGDRFDAMEYLKLLKANYPGSEPDIIQMIESRLNEQSAQ